jgi:hypothetical protein
MDIKEITSWNPDHLEYDREFAFQDYYWMLPDKAVGLFGVNQGTIDNVHVASGKISVSEIKTNTESIALGAICGYNDGGYITSCTSNAELKVHTILPEGRPSHIHTFTVGGICGTSRGSIEYSINYGDIIIDNGKFNYLFVGGISGNLYSRYKTDEIKINSCINHGNILSNEIIFVLGSPSIFCYFGGISGIMHSYHYSSSNETIQHISNCYNTGDIINKGTKMISGMFSGIVPIMLLSTHSCKLSSCYTIGSIKIENPLEETAVSDPIVCHTLDLEAYNIKSLPLYEVPIETCFYNATTWTGDRKLDLIKTLLHLKDKDLLNEYAEKIIKATPAFSSDSWPTSDLWDTSVWRDLGSWNGGNPIYPKLRFEKD